jgi:hypothetical protein
MKIRKLKLLFALFLCISFNSYAMPDLPQPQPRGIPPVGDPVPIDNELWIVFVSALLLGIFYLLKNSKSTA